MTAIRKLINDPEHMAPELLEGVVAACHGRIRQLDEPGALVKTRLAEDKVGLLIGGVCGHEPLFSMLIGTNLADGAACGGVYRALQPPVILAAIRALDRGRGVLCVFGNWRSNRKAFAAAETMAGAAGIVVRTVPVWDDVGSAPRDQMEQRGGIAGDLLVIKVAGAATARGQTLQQAYTLTVKARDNTRSIAVKLSSGTIPGTGEPLYALTPGVIEIGSRLHGQGCTKTLSGATITADEVVQCMMDQLLADDWLSDGDEVCLLINNLGSTTCLEMLIANRKVREILRHRNIAVHQTFIGSYFTCQETAGLTLTLMKLDEHLRPCVDAPADSLGFSSAAR